MEETWKEMTPEEFLESVNWGDPIDGFENADDLESIALGIYESAGIHRVELKDGSVEAYLRELRNQR
ncbi:hypothetical protein [Fundidesulfovibrio soli]|uniref:hypothetical protein n=1 Tax=Fundidesulfovibrio soli TaxID=2922716 RepID=UPI001FAF519B|nr:hypothetical protein [Fundidesulfovibrio soli]